MSLKKYRKYNRTFEKDNKRELINLFFENLVEGKLENISYNEIKPDKKLIFITDYLGENNYSECKKCIWPNCFLKYNYECGIIGIKIESILDKKETQIYQIKEISRYNPFIIL